MTTNKTTVRLNNEQARRLFMHRQGLGTDPKRKLTDDEWLQLITSMGFVQVDSVQTLARAHDAILFSRNQTYRQATLKRLIEKRGDLFENWTHDAAIIPAQFYPYWQLRFARERARLIGRWENWGRDFAGIVDEVLAHVRTNGPTRARDLCPDDKRSNNGWWDWHPGKTALEFHWRTGTLAIKARDGMQKIYDLSERVLPAHWVAKEIDEAAMVDWCCRAALERLGTATVGEIAAFFDHLSPKDVAAWRDLQTDLIEVDVENHDGSVRSSLTTAEIAESADLSEPLPKRLRLLSPFDPILRDRKRAQRLFNFDYRIEIFVPAAKRKYGYYVFPILEGTKLIGRIDVTADLKSQALQVKGLWFEPGIKATKSRLTGLEQELDRYRRWRGLAAIDYQSGWQRWAM